MKLNYALERLHNARAEWESLGVRDLYLFGSVADDTAHPESDVDVLVDFVEPQGLFRLIQVRHLLENVLERRIDVVTEDALKGPLRESVLSSLVKVTRGR